LGKKPKKLHFCVFGCGAYVFLPIEIHANKLAPHSELMIFIRYKDYKYHFIYHTQENTIFCSTYAIFDEGLFIFDEGLFPKYTNSYAKEHKLYDELLDKTSLKTKSLAPKSSGKDGPAPVPIPHTLISLIQNNSPTHSSLPFLFYKSISP